MEESFDSEFNTWQLILGISDPLQIKLGKSNVSKKSGSKTLKKTTSLDEKRQR